MPLPSQEELITRALSFRVINPSETRTGDDVIVERRAGGEWAVIMGGCVVNRSGFREYEGFPSNLTESFKRRTRFTLEQAWGLAERYGRESPQDYNDRLEAKIQRSARRQESSKAEKGTQ